MASCGSSARARSIPSLLRALVILRGGLTPALHWAHAFLCATSCLIGGEWLDQGKRMARPGCFGGNNQTIKKTPEGGPAAKAGFFLCATQLTPLTTGRDNRGTFIITGRYCCRHSNKRYRAPATDPSSAVKPSRKHTKARRTRAAALAEFRQPKVLPIQRLRPPQRHRSSR